MNYIHSSTRLFLFIFYLLCAIGCKKNENKKEDNIASGTTGNLNWTLNSDGTLNISGVGEMPNYFYNIHIPELWPPWPIDSIKAVVIKDGITSIGNGAFFNTALTSVTIPNSVVYIGIEAFAQCRSLTSVTIPNSVTFIENNAFTDCRALTSLIIGNSVKSIGNGAFGGCRALTSVTIPNSVITIGDEAFVECRALTSLTIGNSVTSIGNTAFRMCYNLTSVIIPNSVKSIGNWAFSVCTGLTSVTISSSVTYLGECAFLGCSGLTSIDVVNSNTSYSSETGVLFNKTKTTLIQYPEGKTGAYYTIPNSVKSIGDWCFSGCIGLSSITIPNSVTSIGIAAFTDCNLLTSITIPNSVTSISNLAFRRCTALNEIINESVTPQEIEADVFSSTDISTCTLRVQAASLDAYRNAPVWRDFGNIVAIE